MTNREEIYIVGGFVRDAVLGRNTQDRDFLVVGWTPDQLLQWGKDKGYVFTQVGADFPVFLDQDGHQWALARTERKTGKGYKGFVVEYDPSVTLEEDLWRRDFTMNAMARRVHFSGTSRRGIDSRVIDPFGGKDDLLSNIIKHVSEAFSEDPVRVLRAARFSATHDLSVAEETLELIRAMAEHGELETLDPHRVWADFEKAMKSDTPSRFFEVLRDGFALDVIFPNLKKAFRPYIFDAIDDFGLCMKDRMALLTYKMDNPQDLSSNMRVPDHHMKLCVKFKKYMDDAKEASRTPEGTLRLFDDLDVWRDDSVLSFSHMLVLGSFIGDEKLLESCDRLTRSFIDLDNVGFNDLSEEEKATLKGKDIGEAIHQLRLHILKLARN